MTSVLCVLVKLCGIVKYPSIAWNWIVLTSESSMEAQNRASSCAILF